MWVENKLVHAGRNISAHLYLRDGKPTRAEVPCDLCDLAPDEFEGQVCEIEGEPFVMRNARDPGGRGERIHLDLEPAPPAQPENRDNERKQRRAPGKGRRNA